MKARSKLVGIGLGVVLLCAPIVARADDDPPAPTAPATDSAEEQAREHHRRGLELFDEGDFRLALVEFERAYTFRGSYKILYNIGQVHLQLNQYARARLALEKYLHDGGEAIAAKRREDVERQLATLRTRTAILTIKVTGSPNAEVRINDVVVGRAPLEKTLVDAGAMKVQVSAPHFSTRTQDVTLVGGDEQVISIVLESDDRPPSPIAPPSTEPAPSTGPSRATIAWIATGVVGVAATATGIAALVSSSSYDEARHSKLEGSPESVIADLERQRDRVQALTLATDILAGATLVAAGVALYFTLHDRSPTSPRVRVQGSMVGIEGRF